MKMMIEDVMQKGNTTSWAVAGLGLVVTGVGRMVGGNLGAGLMGFGLAHLVLGLADMFRPVVRN
jgi:hypothetical protein